MSFSEAVGQIDQIVQWEQQLADPAALTQTTSSTGTDGTDTAADATSSTSATDASAAASFATALAEAQAQGGASAISDVDPTTTDDSDLLSGGDSQLLTALSSLSGSDSSDSTSSSDELSALESALESSSDTATAASDSATAASDTATTASVSGESGAAGGTATSPDDPRIEAMTDEANALVGKPYVYGGGHDGWGPSDGYDCSGFVSAVLHAGGYLSTPQDTATLPSAAGMESGPGQYVTVYDRDESGQQGHVIIDIDGQFYESGGEQGSWGGGGGVEKISTPSASYLASFNTVLHPAGL